MLYHITMEQIQQFKQEQEVILEKSIGNLFEEFLTKKNRLAEFDEMAKYTNVIIGNEFVRLTPKGFPALVKDILKMVVKSTQELRFQPATASG